MWNYKQNKNKQFSIVTTMDTDRYLAESSLGRIDSMSKLMKDNLECPFNLAEKSVELITKIFFKGSDDFSEDFKKRVLSAFTKHRARVHKFFEYCFDIQNDVLVNGCSEGHHILLIQHTRACMAIGRMIDNMFMGVHSVDGKRLFSEHTEKVQSGMTRHRKEMKDTFFGVFVL